MIFVGLSIALHSIHFRLVNASMTRLMTLMMLLQAVFPAIMLCSHLEHRPSLHNLIQSIQQTLRFPHQFLPLRPCIRVSFRLHSIKFQQNLRQHSL